MVHQRSTFRMIFWVVIIIVTWWFVGAVVCRHIHTPSGRMMTGSSTFKMNRGPLVRSNSSESSGSNMSFHSAMSTSSTSVTTGQRGLSNNAPMKCLNCQDGILKVMSDTFRTGRTKMHSLYQTPPMPYKEPNITLNDANRKLRQPIHPENYGDSYKLSQESIDRINEGVSNGRRVVLLPMKGDGYREIIGVRTKDWGQEGYDHSTPQSDMGNDYGWYLLKAKL